MSAVVTDCRTSNVIGLDAGPGLTVPCHSPVGRVNHPSLAFSAVPVLSDLHNLECLRIAPLGLRLQPVRPAHPGVLLPQELPLSSMLFTDLRNVGLAGKRGQTVKRLPGQPVATHQPNRCALEVTPASVQVKLCRLTLLENDRLGRPRSASLLALLFVLRVQG